MGFARHLPLMRSMALLATWTAGCAAPVAFQPSVYPSVAYNSPEFAGRCPALLSRDRPLVSIPEGSFLRGDPSGEGNPDERPATSVHLPAYFIDSREVTIGEYRRCVEAGHCDARWLGHEQLAGQPPAPSAFCSWGQQPDDHPVTCVSWFEAVRFCQCHGLRLPTESEWERAARGDEDARPYPWGDRAPGALHGALANLADASAAERFPTLKTIPGYDDGHPLTAPTGSFPGGRSPHGLDDTLGNVTEWTLTLYDRNAYRRSAEGRPNPLSQPLRVARGAGFDSVPGTVRLTRRWTYLPWDRSHSLGFRCAMSAERLPSLASRRPRRPALDVHPVPGSRPVKQERNE